jgi:ubiquinone/menaquinone biosynthesis C-methylase UbiE
MLRLSAEIISPLNINLKKTDGVSLDFPTNYFDIAFTSTVLQHNTDESNLQQLVAEICRITKEDIYIFERTEKKIKGHESNIGRPVNYYRKMFEQNRFELHEVKYQNIQASYFLSGVVRKLFNPSTRKEGQKISKISFFLETILLPVTKIIDPVIPMKRDLTMLHFRKTG